MHIVEDRLADVRTTAAYQVGDLVIVRVGGEKPTPCHLVSIERALTDVEPPAFVVRLATDPRVRCPQVVVEYEEVQAFRIGSARDQILVHHAGGTLTVDVQHVSVDGDAIPGKGVAADGSAAPSTRSAAVAFDPSGEPVEAYGYSRSYDLAEAVRDAIAKLPPRGAGIPDWLSSYTVVSLDVEIGGIAGFNHLRATVRG